MTFLFDHDVPAVAARILRNAGFAVTELREVMPVNADDGEVLAYAIRREMILVTCNRDDFLTLAAAWAALWTHHSGSPPIPSRGSWQIAGIDPARWRIRSRGKHQFRLTTSGRSQR